MWDAFTLRRPWRRPILANALIVTGIFGFFQKRSPALPREPKIKVEPPAPVQSSTLSLAAVPRTRSDPELLKQRLLYHGLHENVDPSTHIRPAEMDCPNCARHFRYFQNPNGLKTVVNCPGCTRPFKL